MDKETVDYLIDYYLRLLPLKVKKELIYPYLTDAERQIKKTELARLLLEDYRDKIYMNNCPVCGKLARTPHARQCRHCGHDWH